MIAVQGRNAPKKQQQPTVPASGEHLRFGQRGEGKFNVQT